LARRGECSDCAAEEEGSKKKTKEKRRKQTSRGTATGCVQPRGARGRGACGCKNTVARLGRDAARRRRKRKRAWGMGVKAHWRRPRRRLGVFGGVLVGRRGAHSREGHGNAVTWLQKRKLTKKIKRKRKIEKTYPPVPVLGVYRVLTRWVKTYPDPYPGRVYPSGYRVSRTHSNP
jgi:hypothetical protein